MGRNLINRFAQAERVQDIPALLQNAPPDTRPAAAWLAFHYCIPSAWNEKPGWLAAYLAGRVAQWRRDSVKGYFDAPYAEPEEIASAIIGLVQGQQVNFFGRALGSAGKDEALDFADERCFGGGWSFCEGAGAQAYRWIDGTQAWLRLPLAEQRALRLTLDVATHDGCGKQDIAVGIDGTTLATGTLDRQRNMTLKVDVPRELVRLPVTQVWIRASAAVPPPGDSRKLSLICQRIVVNAG